MPMLGNTGPTENAYLTEQDTVTGHRIPADTAQHRIPPAPPMEGMMRSTTPSMLTHMQRDLAQAQVRLEALQFLLGASNPPSPVHEEMNKTLVDLPASILERQRMQIAAMQGTVHSILSSVEAIEGVLNGATDLFDLP